MARELRCAIISFVKAKIISNAKLIQLMPTKISPRITFIVDALFFNEGISELIYQRIKKLFNEN